MLGGYNGEIKCFQLGNVLSVLSEMKCASAARRAAIIFALKLKTFDELSLNYGLERSQQNGEKKLIIQQA